VDGILLFNKPILWTSHDAVDFVRRRTGQRAVGHAGTLDPLATGLLILLVGRATKRSAEFADLDKDYFGTMTLGVETETQDMEGRILRQTDASDVTPERLGRAFSGFVGQMRQTTPLYSAVKRGGRKLYELARSGAVAEAAPSRTVTLSDFRLLEFPSPEVHFFLTCSKGTYVRALCDDVGRELGCGAALSSLVRSRIGPHRLSAALGEEDVRRLGPAGLEGSLLAAG
jgi:tRNA pseudouridine55 synthase